MPEEFRSVRAQLPPQAEDLVAAFRDPFTQIDFLRLIAGLVFRGFGIWVTGVVPGLFPLAPGAWSAAAGRGMRPG